MMHWQKLDSRAISLRNAGHVAEAIEHLIRAIELARPAATLRADTGSMLNYLADIYLSEGMLTEAESTIRDAMRYEVEPGNGITAANLMILAKVMHRQGRCTEAVRTGRQALVIYKRELGWRSEYVRQSKKTVAAFKKPPVNVPVRTDKVAERT